MLMWVYLSPTIYFFISIYTYGKSYSYGKNIVMVISSVISNPASKIIQTDTSSVILRKHPRFSTIQKVGS